MTVKLNHTIVHARDKEETARHLVDILGLARAHGVRAVPRRPGGQRRLPRLRRRPRRAAPAALRVPGRARRSSTRSTSGSGTRGLECWADPFHRQPGRDQHQRRRPRALLERPGRAHPGDHHRPLRRLAMRDAPGRHGALSGSLIGGTFLAGVFGGIALRRDVSAPRLAGLGRPRLLRAQRHLRPAQRHRAACLLCLARFGRYPERRHPRSRFALALTAANAVGTSVAVGALGTSGVATAPCWAGRAATTTVPPRGSPGTSFVAGGPIHGVGFAFDDRGARAGRQWDRCAGPRDRCAPAWGRAVAGALCPLLLRDRAGRLADPDRQVLRPGRRRRGRGQPRPPLTVSGARGALPLPGTHARVRRRARRSWAR